MQTSEKLAYRVQPHTALQPECIERGDHQTHQPLAARFGFPQPRLWMDGPPLHGLRETMHTAFGTPRLLGNPSYTLLAVVTQTVENPQAFGPKSHVGRLSEGGLNSCRNSAPQRT